MNITYPEVVKPSDMEQFCAVFKQMVSDKVKTIEYNRLGMVIKIYFKDGSSCGGAVPWINTGLIDKDELGLRK